MNALERKIFATDDWLARHPKVLALLMVATLLFVAYFEEVA